MRKILLIVLVVFILFSNLVYGDADTKTKTIFEVNGTEVIFADVQPYKNNNGIILVPIRYLTEHMGGKAMWSSRSQQIIVTLNGNTLILSPGIIEAKINGDKFELESPITVKTDRSFAPLSMFLSLGAEINFNNSIHKVSITYKNSLSTIKDPFFYHQWSINDNFDYIDEHSNCRNALVDIHMIKAWQMFSAKKSVIIAIIDTGVDYSHEDLKLNIWSNKSEIANDNIDNDNNGYIDDIHGWNFVENSNVVYSKLPIDDHGTHIAGIIAGSSNNIGIKGIISDPLVKIMILKVVDLTSNNNQQENLINAITYADKMGADICNISFGTYFYDQKLKDVIDKSKMMFVVAAGNSNLQGQDLNVVPLYPAAYTSENIISVANLQCDGKLNLTSNYGLKSVDIAAPGTSIWSTLTDNNYGYLTGTSMATPMVTGILAMIYSNYNYISLYDAKKILLNSCEKIPGLEDKVFTGGIPNASKALSYDKESIEKLK